jgi:alginate O-acetyltransferase complex protein AlgI
VLFCSRIFGAFFLIVFLLHWSLPWQRARVWLLLLASFVFYASWNHWLAALVVGTALVDYLIAHGMEMTGRQVWRRALLVLSLSINLGVLCYFKYANFFLQSLQDVVRAAGGSASLGMLEVILPIGISFYTFEAINYTVDVYRRRIRAERDMASFLLFILFFPHLIAGPIVRARDFLPQIKRPKRFSWGRARLGVALFLLGLFKKLAIADRMALFADPVFGDPGSYGSLAVWGAMIAYVFQVYCDFSGYTDMALGCAHLLGYKLAQNFDRPYLSPNIAHLWRRWHMSLSSWLRDYLYFPLGGSRCGETRTRVNLVVTMALGGLWHGPSWLYVGWGILQGIFLSVHRAFRIWCERRPGLGRALTSPVGTLLRIAFTMLCFSCSLIIFRSQSWGNAFCMLGKLIPLQSGSPPPQIAGLWLLAAVAAAVHVAGRTGLPLRWAGRLPPPVVGVGYAALLSLALVLAPGAVKPFVYFQF